MEPNNRSHGMQYYNRLQLGCPVNYYEGRIPVTFSPAEVSDWFGVTTKTAREWLHGWFESDFVKPLGEIRARTWTLGESWHELIVRIARLAAHEDRQ